MMPFDPNRAQALFLAALDLSDVKARRDLLERECADNAEVRKRVDALLSAHDATMGFGHQPSGHATGDSPMDMQPGDQIGRYKLTESIGEGGMGTVWVAE